MQPMTSIRDFSKTPPLYIWSILLHHTTSCVQNIFIHCEVLPVFIVHVSSKPLFHECHWLDFDNSLDLPLCLDVVWITAFGHCLFHDLDIGFWCGFCNNPPTHGFSHISSGLLVYTFYFPHFSHVGHAFFCYMWSHIMYYMYTYNVTSVYLTSHEQFKGILHDEKCFHMFNSFT